MTLGPMATDVEQRIDLDALRAEAEAALVCYDPTTGASRPMEDSFRAALARRPSAE